MIVTDKSKIQEKCLPTTIEEGEEIGIKLLDELRKSNVASAEIKSPSPAVVQAERSDLMKG